jgi:tetratricopeptide (TPR) repeat protein
MRAFLTLFLAAAASAAGQTPDDLQRANVHYQTGWTLFRSEKLEDAAREFQKAIDLHPQFELAFYGLGRTNMALKRYAAAAQAYTACRDIYLAQGLSRPPERQQELLEHRIFELEQILRETQQGPQNRQSQELAGEIRVQLQQFKSMVRQSARATPPPSVPAFVHLALGSAHFRQEQFADAEREYLAAITAEPKYGEAHNNLAVVYLMTDRAEAADKHARLAERAGYAVNPGLKEAIKKARR